jgi:hypothetical protein
MLLVNAFGVSAATQTKTALSVAAKAVFDSEISAIEHASRVYNDISKKLDVEYMGAVLKSPSGKYIYTVSSGEPGDHQVKLKIRIPKGYEIMSFWHTHGAERYTSKYFSDVDTALSNKTHKPIYMIDHSDTLRVYTPGAPTIPKLAARKLRIGSLSGFAKGKTLVF